MCVFITRSPNPRGWTIGHTVDGHYISGQTAWNTTNLQGVQEWQEAMKGYVQGAVNYCTGYMAGGPSGHGPARCSGLILWSMEGQQYPQTISYIGAPDMLPILAPEMVSASLRSASFLSCHSLSVVWPVILLHGVVIECMCVCAPHRSGRCG